MRPYFAGDLITKCECVKVGKAPAAAKNNWLLVIDVISEFQSLRLLATSN
jgi:hypothetical protein